jgi:hypothetical protein
MGNGEEVGATYTQNTKVEVEPEFQLPVCPWTLAWLPFCPPPTSHSLQPSSVRMMSRSYSEHGLWIPILVLPESQRAC